MVTMFAQEDQVRLLQAARRSLDARVRCASAPAPDIRAPLDRRRGAFVSLHCGADLRGCLGRITPDWPIGRVVADLAAAVSDSDPRFAPVVVEELDALRIEVSILIPERPATVDEIEIGRHGLIVEGGGRRGLLLPQVAVGHAWDAMTFLEHTCVKAGLSRDAWQHGARLFVFEAQVFGEHAGAHA